MFLLVCIRGYLYTSTHIYALCNIATPESFYDFACVAGSIPVPGTKLRLKAPEWASKIQDFPTLRLKAPNGHLRLQDSQSHFPRETTLKPLVHF